MNKYLILESETFSCMTRSVRPSVGVGVITDGLIKIVEVALRLKMLITLCYRGLICPWGCYYCYLFMGSPHKLYRTRKRTQVRLSNNLWCFNYILSIPEDESMSLRACPSSVGVFPKGEKLHFHAPIGVHVTYMNQSGKD